MNETIFECQEIHDDLGAELALHKLRDIQNEYDRLISDCEWLINFYKRRADELTAKRTDACASVESMLALYFSTVPHKRTKTQETYALPSGKLVMKQPPTQFKRDDAALGQWLKASGYGDLVETKLEPKWGELKKRGVQVLEDGQCVYTETGEIIPGVTAAVPAPVFQVIARDAQ